MSDLGDLKYFGYCIPLIESLKELGGSAKTGEAIDCVLKKLNITRAEASQKTKGGKPIERNRVQWAGFYLVKFVYMDFTKRGIWRLTEKGWKEKPEPTDLQNLVQEVGEQSRKGRQKTLSKIAGT